MLLLAPRNSKETQRAASGATTSTYYHGYVLGRFSSAVPLAPKLQAPISTQSHLERIAVLRSHNVVLLLTSLPKTTKKGKKSAKHSPASNGDRSSRKVRISQQLEQAMERGFSGAGRASSNSLRDFGGSEDVGLDGCLEKLEAGRLESVLSSS